MEGREGGRTSWRAQCHYFCRNSTEMGPKLKSRITVWSSHPQLGLYLFLLYLKLNLVCARPILYHCTTSLARKSGSQGGMAPCSQRYCPHHMSEKTVGHIAHVQWIGLREKCKSAINRNKPWRHCALRSKPVADAQTRPRSVYRKAARLRPMWWLSRARRGGTRPADSQM